MYSVELTKSQVNNLLAFLTGKGRVQLTGDEAMEFVTIVNAISIANPVAEETAKEAPVEEE